MSCALGEVRDVNEYVVGLEVSPTGRWSLLEGLRINSESSDNLEQVGKEIWMAAVCFRGAVSLT